jgi:hypothetical protein
VGGVLSDNPATTYHACAAMKSPASEISSKYAVIRSVSIGHSNMPAERFGSMLNADATDLFAAGQRQRLAAAYRRRARAVAFRQRPCADDAAAEER